ncbi:MAG: 2-oxoglutarate dehydrogenase E2 component (dihydrolipoamide succinyltransferase) [Verrucomicrobiales bacterium]|jgi:2-oxoglutarate dehydrogenase E2 component (dihydrolipoamide succinyltransferase)
MIEVKIPSVGESVSSGQIAQWHVVDGARVSAGDVLLTLETDKVSTEIEAPESGVIHLKANEGDEVAVGSVIAQIEPGDAPEKPAASPQPEVASEQILIAPTVQKLAEENGLDLHRIKGTGAKSRITKADVEDAIAAEPEPVPALSVVETPPAKSEPTAPAAAVSEAGRTTRKSMSPLRRKIATHLVNAQQTAAILTTFNECDLSEVMRLRKSMQENFVAAHGVKLGFMSFFVKAVVAALRAVPTVNARIDGDEIVQHHFYDIGVAIGTEKGLIVPVLRDCAEKSFAEIEKDIVEYATRAREGRIVLADLQGGVFTISNGGIYGSMLSTPILNSPQSAILGMHTIQERPVAVDGEVVIRPMMYLALSYDHRLIDGKEAVTFLLRIKDCVENPARLLLGV